MTLTQTASHIARGVSKLWRRPASAQIRDAEVREALRDLPHVRLIERRTAGISTTARLQRCSWGLHDRGFRGPVMVEPDRPFGLAQELGHPLLTSIVSSREVAHGPFDIQEITRLSLSKGPLDAYATLGEFALGECRSEIGPADQHALEACLRHYGVRLTTPFQSGGDGLEAISWSGGDLYWPNSDGSHHFAAARHIAAKLKWSIPVRAPLTVHLIDGGVVGDLHRRYSGWVLPDTDEAWEVVRLMHDGGAHIGMAGMPHPYDAVLLLLPRDKPASMVIAAAIEASGATAFRRLTDRWLALQREAQLRWPALFGQAQELGSGP